MLLTHDGCGHVSFENPSKRGGRAKSAYLVHLVASPCGTVCPSDWQAFDPELREAAQVKGGAAWHQLVGG